MAVFSPTETCFEIPGTLIESLDQDGPKASVDLLCAWTDRWSLITDLLTTPRLWPYSVGGTYFPCYARSASARPVLSWDSVSDQSYNWEFAEVTVNYGVYDLEDRVVFSEEMVPGANAITLDPHGFRWGAANGDQLRDEEQVAYQDVVTTWRLTRYRLNAIPSFVYPLFGRCNDSTLVSPSTGQSFAAQRVMLNGWKAEQSRNVIFSGSDGKFDVTVEMLVRANSWNEFIRGNTGQYTKIYLPSGAQYTPYPPDDFSDIVA